MKNNLIFRIAIDIVLLLLVIYGMWHIALIFGIFASWRFPYFIEFIASGIIFDSLFGYSDSLGILGYSGTLISIIVFIIMNLLKKILRR